MSMNERLKPVSDQGSAYDSPWSTGSKIKRLLYGLTWTLTCRWTPNPFNIWRLLVLRLFGTKISGRPYVAASAKLRMPWNVTLEHRACVAPGTELYALGKIILRERCTVAQHSYLCAASHDVTVEALPLTIGTIEIGADVMMFAFTFVAPGVTVGEGAVIGAASVVTKDMPAWTICAGNPCKPLKPRQFPRAPAHKTGNSEESA